uniref:Very long-chain fatty acid transport protein n=1 Tax=Aceria tosichella TaxID=561515 RepID=A0A6G1S5F0_9ACAR
MNVFGQIAIAAFTAYVVTGGWRYLRVVLITLPRDLTGLIRLIQTHWFLYKLRKRNATVPQVFKENCQRDPDRVIFYYEDQRWTMRMVDEFSNRVANAFLEHGYQPGQEVALFMESRPEFVATWLGLAKAGLVTALINTNQRMDTLIHSITVVNCRALVFGSELGEHVDDIYDKIRERTPTLEFYQFGDLDACKRAQTKSLKAALAESSSNDPSTLHSGSFLDRLFYIYTSGTTGLPKAAIIKHSRYMFVGAGLRNLLCLNNEIIYTSIPLYHLAGGIMGTSQCLIFNSAMVIKRRFSASQFWPDCIKYNATCAQYIGELCRYLLSQPKRDCDRQHQVKLMFGNGLRPQIWREFVDRFNIKRIGEFYGSTEGNANIVNFDNTPGACGFVSRILPIVYPVTLIKCNPQTGVPERDNRGVCKRCGPGETGEFVGKIIEGDPTRSFDGYANSEATKKKIVRDVFWRGDMAFSSGDLLEMDELGYVYFKDRTGDTYRWKGENVSTMEVEGIVSELLEQQDCVVYGVEVPNCEGKAGMLALASQEHQVDLKKLVRDMKTKLAPFAIPVFIRLVDQIEATGTFKLPKVKLQQQGYNINKLQDPIYLVDLKQNDCLRLTPELYEKLQSGELKV